MLCPPQRAYQPAGETLRSDGSSGERGTPQRLAQVAGDARAEGGPPTQPLVQPFSDTCGSDRLSGRLGTYIEVPMSDSINQEEIGCVLHPLLRQTFRSELKAFARNVLSLELEKLRVQLKSDMLDELQTLNGYKRKENVTHASTLANGAVSSGAHDDVARTTESSIEAESHGNFRVVSSQRPSKGSKMKACSATSTLTSVAGTPSQVLYLGKLIRGHVGSLHRSNLQRNISSGSVNSTMTPLLKMERTLDAVMDGFIILNVVQMGISTDVKRNWSGWLVVDGVFASSFMLEFIAKIMIHGLREHLCGNNWKWNLFDAIVVAVAFLELILTLTPTNYGVPGMGSVFLFRIVRLLRLARIVKLLRFNFFRELIMMFEGLMMGAPTLFWSIVLLMMPLYAMAIVLRETVGESTQESVTTKPFDTLLWAFFTCFRCIMGDCSSESGTPLPVLMTQKFGAVFGISYFLSIVMTAFGLFNVIVAIYVENIVASVKKNDSIQQRRRLNDMQRLDSLMIQLVKAFVQFSEDEGDVAADRSQGIKQAARVKVTRTVFDECIGMPEVHDILNKLDIAEDDRLDLFDVLDADQSGALTLGEIVEGLKKLRGEPRRSDIVSNGLLVRQLQRQAVKTRDDLNGGLAKLSSEVHEICKCLKKPSKNL